MASIFSCILKGSVESTVLASKKPPWDDQGSLSLPSLTLFRIASLLLAPFYDIIHIHSCEGIGRTIKSLFPGKPVIFHYHGSDIRDKWREKSAYHRDANAILISTRDLLEGAPEGTIYLPIPIETWLFYDRRQHMPATAFSFSYGADDLARRHAKEMGLSLTLHDRFASPILHSRLPEVFSKYEYYIDVKSVDGRLIKDTSKAALEALASGCKVVRYDGTVLEGLPREHIPESVAGRLLEIYKGAVKR